MAMTHVRTNGEMSSRPNRLAPREDPMIMGSQKTRGAVVRRGYDARLIGM